MLADQAEMKGAYVQGPGIYIRAFSGMNQDKTTTTFKDFSCILRTPLQIYALPFSRTICLCKAPGPQSSLVSAELIVMWSQFVLLGTCVLVLVGL